jgi:hypothetical protein
MEFLVNLDPRAVLLGLHEGLEHNADGHLSVLTDGLLSQVHLGVGCIGESLPSQMRIMDSR